MINDLRKRSRALLILLIPVGYLLLTFAAVPPECDAAAIGRISVSGLHSIEQQELLDMLGLNEGETIDARLIRQGIKRAFLKGIFDDITVESDGRDPSEIRVIVRERDIINKVLLQGDYQLPARRIRELLLFREEDIMREDLIEEAIRDLKKQYGLAGYPHASIEIAVRRTRAPSRVDVLVTAEAGPPERILRVKVSENDFILRSDIRIQDGDIYDQNRLNSELQRIKETMKSAGYYRPAVGPYGYRDGELSIVVEPGKRLFVSLEGNSEVSDKILQKEIPFFEIEAFNDEIVDEAISRMVSAYHREGYASAQIAPVIREDEKAIYVSFFIFEGRRIEIRSITFSGAFYAESGLKSVMEMKVGAYYNPDLRERDRESLAEFYHALGYLEATVREIEASFDEGGEYADISVTLEEGARTVISSIEVKGITPELNAKLMAVISLKVGDPYNEVDILDARFRILDYYANQGYSAIDVSIERNIQNHKAAIVLTVSEGVKKSIGKTIISGNRRTRYAAIKRELRHTEGEAYNFRTISQERQRLYRLGLFTDVDIETYDSGDDRKDLLVRLKEGNAGSFEFGFGYADYEKYRGYAEVSYRNLWGMNRQGILRTELSSLQKRVLLQYYEPWFLDRPLPFRMFFLYDDTKEITVPTKEVRYRVERYSLSAGIEQKLTDTVKSEFYYEYSLVNTSDVQPDVILSKEDVGTLAISSVRPSLIYDTRDSPFDPSRGVLAGISVKIASPLLFSETHFAKIILYSNFFHQLHKRVTLALSARAGVAYGFGSTEELPIVERFFLGGRSSVRGYEQDTLGPKGFDGDPTGGNAFAMGSIEARTYIGKGISIVPFIDCGNVWVSANDFSLSDIKYTAGIGLRYATPVGPLRVDYGFKLNREKDESAGEIHFSIGHAF